MKLSRWNALPLLMTAFALADTAAAQRADENAVREAEDGFGKSVGSDSVGIYASSKGNADANL